MRIGRGWRYLVVCTGLGLVQVLAGCARQTDGRAAEGPGSTPASAETTAAKDPLELLGVKGSAHLQEAELVPLRDGTHLMATVLLPDDVSQASKRPAILIQSPYPIDLEFQMGQQVLARLVREGYVIAVVNDRGTQWSEGQYHWLKNASEDGADVVQWLTQQPWSNGSVGAWGCSSSGEVNFALAKARPRGLKAIVAMAAATGIGVIPGFSDQGVFYTGGVPLLDWAWWYHGNGYINHPKLPPNLPQDERIALIHTFNPVALSGDSEDLSWATHLPSQELLNSIGSPQTQFNALIKMKPNDPEWRSYDFLNDGDRLTVPVLHIDSWYDTIEIYGTAKAFEYLSRNSPDQYLIVGPGPHCSMGFETRNSKVGERLVGDARFDYAGQIVNWFDHWLKHDGRGEFPMARVQYYPLESNRWVRASTWPPPSAARKLYLASSGRANGSSGDGRLVAAVEDGAPDRFLSDPLHPVPTHGGGCCTPEVARDQTEIEKRQDVLIYTSAPLAKPLDIAGYIRVTLHVSTSVPDTDIALKLVDVYPDGKAYNLLDTMQRLRFRNGIDQEALLQKDSLYTIELRQMVVASHFDPGHRLRIEIAGTNFPQYERNMNTGKSNFDESHALVAEDVIYHDKARASFLELPVVH